MHYTGLFSFWRLVAAFVCLNSGRLLRGQEEQDCYSAIFERVKKGQ